MMIPSAAKALGRPKQKCSWAELTASATESDKVRLGAADPAGGVTGLLALTGIAAPPDKPGGDGDTRVTATAELLAQRMSDGDTQALETPAQDDSAAEGAATRGATRRCCSPSRRRSPATPARPAAEVSVSSTRRTAPRCPTTRTRWSTRRC
ncbi:hypothetical protein ACFYWN_26215 [Streptomyces sp. NPDC002917]|uniref:hypothetical protein n=1 Tax=unclassified Streptomyces TaxID=2593676 RepID=UPI0036836610